MLKNIRTNFRISEIFRTSLFEKNSKKLELEKTRKKIIEFFRNFESLKICKKSRKNCEKSRKIRKNNEKLQKNREKIGKIKKN